MTTTSDQLRALLGDTAFRALEALARSSAPVSGRALARAVGVAPTTANSALATLKKAGFVRSSIEGRSTLWRLNAGNPTMRDWRQQAAGVSAQLHGVSTARARMNAVIFTALQLEYEAVVAHLPARCSSRVRTTRFESGEFEGEHVDWTVHVAELGPGNISAAVEVAAAVGALEPHLVLFVGVAASVKPKDLVHGDVVVADRVYNLQSGKDVQDAAEGSIHLTRPVSFTATHGAVQLAMDVRRRDWSDRSPFGSAFNARGTKPRVEIKPIAACEHVHADGRSALMEKLRRNFNDVAAVDMESLGLYEAAHKDNLPALAVRGISDCVADKDPDADEEWQPRAARHAAAFAFALLARAEPDDLPSPGARPVPDGSPAQAQRPSPAELLLRVAPTVALAYEWALPRAGTLATDVLAELADLGSRTATWLSRFRHRQPQQFRGEGNAALWVLVAEFADSHDHPVTPWLFEQATQRWSGDVLSGYLHCKASLAAARLKDAHQAEARLAHAEAAVPDAAPLWAAYRAMLVNDLAALGAAVPGLAQALRLPLPPPVRAGLEAVAPSTTIQPDDAFRAFVEEFAEEHAPFLELVRLHVMLGATFVLRETPGQISAAQKLSEELARGMPAYDPGPASKAALEALGGSRSSTIMLELAATLLARAASPDSRVSGFDRDAALARAEQLALTARDRRQDWGGPTGDALALAARARAASGDIHGALAMLVPPPAGTAEPAECAAQSVVQVAAGLAAQTGKIDLALELAAKIDDPVERNLATALALTLRDDSHPEAVAEFRSALEHAVSEDQQARALLGLAMVAPLDENDLARLDSLDAELADLTRAQSLLTMGKITQAQILARRYPDSDGALQIRVACLVGQGKISDAVSALETFAVRHNHDEQHLLSAALLAHTRGSAHDASRLAVRLAASTDPVRRRTAREILLDNAGRDADWEAVLDQSRQLIDDDAIAEADPNRDESLIKYRWVRAHALHQLRRMPDAYEEIRAEPRLRPTDVNQARLIASILRTIAPSVAASENSAHEENSVTQSEVLSDVTQAAQAFPDDEELVATAVLAAFSMPAGEQLDFALMAKARQLQQQFFEHFPESKHIQRVPVDDQLTSLQEFLRARFAPTANATLQLHRAVVTGQVPISAFVNAMGRSYADALVRNDVGCYVIGNPDPAICAQEQDAARGARDGAVVVDTSALLLSRAALEPTTELRAHFEKLLIAESQRDDILQAHNSLSMRSSGWLGWDPRTERPVFAEYSPEVVEGWAVRSEALAAAAEDCDVLPDPPPGTDEPGPHAWTAPIRLARERGLPLVADDAALRAVARRQGVAAFSSLQLLESLVEDGVLPGDALERSYCSLTAARAADLPITASLVDIASAEGWKPDRDAAFLLTRPRTWLPLQDGWSAYTTLVKASPHDDPESTAAWCLAALNGMCLTTDPAALTAVASALVAWTLLELRDGAVLPVLLGPAEALVKLSVPDADLLNEIVQRLVRTVRQIAPPEMVGAIVLPLLSALSGEQHVTALRTFFTTP